MYEYVPNPPLEFQTNDILGLHQPRILDTQVALYYQIWGEPQTFRIASQDSPLVNINAPSPSYANLLFVAVEVNGKLNIFCCFYHLYNLYKTIMLIVVPFV